MKKGMVSVIIVNWNGKKWLKRCLDSLISQNYKNFEILFIDNGSSDGSLEYVKKYYGRKLKILASSKNLGLTGGINLGIKESKGKYLLLINNDVWIKKDFIKNLVSYYNSNDFAVIAPKEKRYDKSQDFFCNTTIDPTGSPAFYVPTYSRKEKIFYLSVCFFCSKAIYEESKGFDKDFFMYHEDVDWLWRLRLLGKKFAFADNIFIYHAGAGSTGYGLKYNMFLWRNQNTLQALIKNYSTATLMFIIPIYAMQNILELFFFLLILKPRISWSYIEGWIFNVKHLKRTLKKRDWIQKHRVVGDREIMKHMYLGPAKAKMLLNYR